MKRKGIWIVRLLIVLVLFTVSCRLTSSLNEIQPTYTPLPSYTPYPTHTQVSFSNTSSDILYQDDFSDPDSGWDRNEWDAGLTDYSEGIYRVISKQNRYDAWANPGQYFRGDVSVEADAYRFRGEDDNGYGLICRYSGNPESANFYFGIISTDGFAVIGKFEEGDSVYISSDLMVPVDGINPNFEINHLRFDCVGSMLTLFVNGNQIAFATDSSFTDGDVGFIAGTFDIPYSEIHFDNVVVARP